MDRSQSLDNLRGRPVVLLLSGGLDSYLCGALARAAGAQIIALTIDYNQRHHCEIAAARRIAKSLMVAEHIILPLDLRYFGGSALTDDIAVPKAQPRPESDEAAAIPEAVAIPVTYVPARNLIFLSLALALAEARKCGDLMIGVNSMDYSGYPDCRPDFIKGFTELARLATKIGDEGEAITIHTPLQHKRKSDIAVSSVAMELDIVASWSCYDPTVDGYHCGACDSCRLRRGAFVEAGLVDPTRYVPDAPPMSDKLGA